MGNQIKLKKRVSGFFETPIRLGFFLLLVNVLILFIDWPSGLVLMVFSVCYVVVVVSMHVHSRSLITNEMVSFATEYGQVQKRLLKNLEIPYCVLDDTGRIIWTNYEFDRTVHEEQTVRRQISALFPSLTKDTLPTGDDGISMKIEYESRNFRVEMRRIAMDTMVQDSDIIADNSYGGALIAVYLFDETAERLAIQEVDDQSLVVGFIYIDNYDEALDGLEDVRKSILVALIDRQVNRYIASVDGICSKMEKDRYLIVLRKRSLALLQAGHFSLLSEAKTVNIGNEMAITLSIGFGMDGLSYAQNYEFARNAIDLALGRGGDQAVVKMPGNILYYGGKTQQVEKTTRVKARVKAEALKEIITARDKVFIMGHRLGDIDCVGAGIGVYRICATLGKEAHIVLNQVSTSLRPIVDLFRDNEEYPEDLFLTSEQAMQRVTEDSALVVVDVNKPSITECPELLRMCKSIVVLDHHRKGSEAIENATLSYIEAYASSACEMVSEVLQYIDDSLRLRQEEADALYAGMVVDTNSFQSKTGVRTFEAAAFLRRSGTDVTRVRKLFREEAAEYKSKADAVSQAEIYREEFAISVCRSDGLESPTVVGAQAANELLNIKGIKASFVLTPYQGKIFVSARSIDEVNVQVIMEHMGGGGHMNIAGAQLEGSSLKETQELLRHTIDSMMDDGEL
jgi:cyclic-di-AMP phosphodiesterase